MLFRLVALALAGCLMLPLPAYSGPVGSSVGFQGISEASLLDAALAELDRQEASRVLHDRNRPRLAQSQGQASSASSEDDGHGVWFWTGVGAGIGVATGLVVMTTSDSNLRGLAPISLGFSGAAIGFFLEGIVNRD